jgi:iron(II)-dependent oxidoreductase
MRPSAERTYGRRLRDVLWSAGRRLCGGATLASQGRRPGRLGVVTAPAPPEQDARPALPHNPAVLVEVMLAEGRYALLLRPQLVGNLSAEQRQRAIGFLARHASLVKSGPVVVLGVETLLADLDCDSPASAVSSAQAIVVDDFFMDRKLVTNREFQQFVAAGGYQEPSIWDPEVWAVVSEFVDRSGAPGPRFWAHGRFEPNLERHPVVGISWYEAAAYARWLGKRLPTDAEWVRAAAAPLLLPGGELRQRKFPWGDKAERNRANLWGAHPAGTVDVDAQPQGDSAGGISQLVGNVWEWTSGNLDLESATRIWPDGSLRSTAMKSLRGGAFDTYFDVQATCQFQSGDHPLARKHNIGFRCALGACDLQPPTASASPESDAARVETNVGAAAAACDQAPQAETRPVFRPLAPSDLPDVLTPWAEIAP